jgi:predicted RNA-binding Zn-ribbon protein involved in translation (DUF1610 family)
MKAPLRCPQCGATMNQHASKIVHSTDEAMGVRETMLNLHACPGCGASAATAD